jgi:small subunit ribosomal protein S2
VGNSAVAKPEKKGTEMEALPEFTMRELLHAGVHFGHHPRRWNPKMQTYIFGVRNGVHIINLEKTVPLLRNALQAVYDVVKSGGRVLFVGTKKQASDSIAEHAKRCGQYYVNHRWLGGMLTNWKTISQSIHRMNEYEQRLQQETLGLTKKEILKLTRERDNLEKSLGGIRDMGGIPDLIFILDVNKEHIAVKEANALGIPVVAILDSNSDPEGINYPIPGNDDAIRSIDMYCRLVADTILIGMKEQMRSVGFDVGESAEIVSEEIVEIVEFTEQVSEPEAPTEPVEEAQQNSKAKTAKKSPRKTKKTANRAEASEPSADESVSESNNG